MARSIWFLRISLSLAFLAVISTATARTSAQTAPEPLILTTLGQATTPVDGQWRFHTGDDPAWSAPGFDDSTWQPIATGESWETQGHPNYTGYGWYRRTLVLPPNTANLNLALYLPQVDSAAEVYWNGHLAGSYGKLPPNPIWYIAAQPGHKVISLGAPPAPNQHSNQPVTLAIRVWKAPYVILTYPGEGGILATPIIGTEQAISNQVAADRLQFDQSQAFGRFVATISGIISVLALVLWFRQRHRRMLLWLALALFMPALTEFTYRRFNPFPFRLTYGTIGTIVELRDVAVWFLLIGLLGLSHRRTLVRWTIYFAVVSVGLQIIEGCLQFFNWDGPLARPLLLADFITTVPCVLLETWGLVLVAAAFRERLTFARWLLAIGALLSALVQFFGDATGLGVRWTHIDVPPIFGFGVLKFGAYPINAESFVVTFFLVTILYAAWRYSIEHSERQTALEQELAHAQEVQQVLIPAQLPAVPGFTVTSAYRPAREVGGDFFQIIPLPGGRTLIVIGDVSGKGLHAAMTVSLIVGSIRTAADTTHSPAQILAVLNHLLHGRLPDGFATCLVLLLEPGGFCTLANAGHLPPFLNDKEVPLPPALPLGLIPQSEYETAPLPIAPGDRLTLYTDGLPEARDHSGELYGFPRIASLLASHPNASQIATAAQNFGQDDDITVLTLAAASL